MQHAASKLKLKNSLSNSLVTTLLNNSGIVYTRSSKSSKMVYLWADCLLAQSHGACQVHQFLARNYLCNDMIRRVLRDHFGYNVDFCMNITDVDDKIIKNSQELGVEYFEFARKWETDFFEDMVLLGVENPEYITRVTQYVPEIISFIEKIIENGYAYSSNQSVYFNIKAFEQKFKYGKLKRIKEAEVEEEETDEKGEKKNKEDFALWKAAKAGEPKWQSKWGEGRPGWHIQCSAMACSILGQKLDIHSGGIDLLFPHHENELAQSQAYNNEAGWVQYFIHVGHLHIKGLKMSKSLKNFITIRELLKIVPVRVIKLYFFMHQYDVILNYDPETSLKEALEKDKRYKNFFSSLKAVIRSESISNPQKLSPEDNEFNKRLEQTQLKIHEAFCHNIDTPGVVDEVDNAIKHTNIYLTSKSLKITLLQKAYRIIYHPFKIMNLEYEQQEAVSSQQTQLINSILKFRDQIRENSKSDFKKILDICDQFRDHQMVDLGIRLEDKKIGEPSTWKYQSTQILLKERDQKIQKQMEKDKKKKEEDEAKLQKMKVNPNDLFRADLTYSKFDQNGLPTHQWKEVKAKKGAKGAKVEKEEKAQKVEKVEKVQEEKCEEKTEKVQRIEEPINEKLKKKLQKQWNEQNERYLKWKQLQSKTQ